MTLSAQDKDMACIIRPTVLLCAACLWEKCIAPAGDQLLNTAREEITDCMCTPKAWKFR